MARPRGWAAPIRRRLRRGSQVMRRAPPWRQDLRHPQGKVIAKKPGDGAGQRIACQRRRPRLSAGRHRPCDVPRGAPQALAHDGVVGGEGAQGAFLHLDADVRDGRIRRSAELTLRAGGHAQPVADGKLDVLAVNRGRASNNREKLPFLTFDNLEKLVFPSFDNREKFYIAL